MGVPASQLGLGPLEGGHLAGQGLVGLRAALRRLSIWLSTVATSASTSSSSSTPRSDSGSVSPDDVVVLERPQDQAQGVRLPDAGEEPVAEPLPGRRSGDQAGDVDELDGGVHHLAAGAHDGQLVERGGRGRGPPRRVVSVVENGWAATGADPPVRALNRLDFPEFGSPTMPSRSINSEGTGGPGAAGRVWAEPGSREAALVLAGSHVQSAPTRPATGPSTRRPTTAASPTGAADTAST